MQVYELSVRVKLKQNLPSEEALSAIASYLDKILCRTGHSELHNKNQYKNYCFNSLYPIEPDKCYKAAGMYAFQVRTLDATLATVFSNQILQETSKYFLPLNTQIKRIPKHILEKIYSITPCIMKNETGYWRKTGNVDDFERRLKENLIKKYNAFTGTSINEEFQLCNSIRFKNKVPITCAYKEIHLLGDKIEIYPSTDKEAQELFHMSLGTGILENNARGFGYMNYQWL